MANPSAPILSNGMTFGIELEFMVVCPVDFFKPQDAIAAISRALVANGIDSTGHEWHDSDDDSSATVEDEIFTGKPEYSQWIVQSEAGLFLSEKEEATIPNNRFEIHCIEISSRKFEFAENWRPEVENVLRVLRSFNECECRFITNSTTGFHIHIGFGNDLVPLRTTKNILQFCTAFEDRLDALYSTDRIDEDCAQNAMKSTRHFNAGLAWHFQNNKATDFGRNVFHWLASIEEASSYEQLGRFFKNEVLFNTNQSIETNAHFATVNIDNLYSRGWEDPKGTIEFRQHAGTLDILAIITHIELTRAIVAWCHFVSDLEFLQICSRVSDPNFRMSSLCQMIGIGKEVMMYHQRRTSVSGESQHMAKYHNAIADMGEGEVKELEALEAQAFVENCERSNWTAVSKRIHSKKIKGAYADLTTAPFDVASNYNAFIESNRPFFTNYQQLSTLARTMVFQQLNGSESS